MSISKGNLKRYEKKVRELYPVGTAFLVVHTSTEVVIKDHKNSDDCIMIVDNLIHFNLKSDYTGSSYAGFCSVLTVNTYTGEEKWAVKISE